MHFQFDYKEKQYKYKRSKKKLKSLSPPTQTNGLSLSQFSPQTSNYYI